MIVKRDAYRYLMKITDEKTSMIRVINGNWFLFNHDFEDIQKGEYIYKKKNPIDIQSKHIYSIIHQMRTISNEKERIKLIEKNIDNLQLNVNLECEKLFHQENNP